MYRVYNSTRYLFIYIYIYIIVTSLLYYTLHRPTFSVDLLLDVHRRGLAMLADKNQTLLYWPDRPSFIYIYIVRFVRSSFHVSFVLLGNEIIKKQKENPPNGKCNKWKFHIESKSILERLCGKYHKISRFREMKTTEYDFSVIHAPTL